MEEGVKGAKGLSWPLGILGGVLGGVVGYFVYLWLAGQGFYAPMVPGAMVGLGCGLLSRGRSVPLGVVCGLAALPVGLFAEWRVLPFVADDSLGYFVRHLHDLKPVTLIMIAIGAALAYWLGVGTTPRPAPAKD
jgi:hypothetical protein